MECWVGGCGLCYGEVVDFLDFCISTVVLGLLVGHPKRVLFFRMGGYVHSDGASSFWDCWNLSGVGSHMGFFFFSSSSIWRFIP